MLASLNRACRDLAPAFPQRSPPWYLLWPAVTHLTSADMWLYVHGKQPSGRPGKLAVSLVHLDKSADEILAAIRAHLPDFVS